MAERKERLEARGLPMRLFEEETLGMRYLEGYTRLGTNTRYDWPGVGEFRAIGIYCTVELLLLV